MERVRGQGYSLCTCSLIPGGGSGDEAIHVASVGLSPGGGPGDEATASVASSPGGGPGDEHCKCCSVIL